ncbi:arsenate reductase family protein [Paludibacteraceae bacterium OttesenSCG-928-F17]|nr:arsenate reductase family protein [Paludibacteraceae bacterium OttesenSCG-928-F17]
MDKITIICYPKCSTCAKAEKWLKDNAITYDYRHIKEENPTVKELTAWIEKSGLPINKFFNTSGMLYREQNIKEKLKTSSQKELIKILASDGMMVKRPIVLYGNKILLGFKEAEWQKAFEV